MKNLPILLFLLISAHIAKGQEANLPHNTLSMQYLDRLEIKSGTLDNGLFMELREVPRSSAAGFLNSLDRSALGPKDSFQLQYLYNELPFEFPEREEESKHPVLKTFYRSKANFFEIDKPDFQLAINPAAYFQFGRETVGAFNPTSHNVYQNTRAIELRGSVDGKVGFYTMLQENQANLPQYVDDRVHSMRAIPGVGFYKGFGNDGSYDYFVARGYITVPATRHIRVQFGHDRNFIGNGYRSLLLSDFSDDYLFLKINTKVWKLNYQNLFTEMTDRIGSTDVPYNKKYGAFHILSLDILKKLNIGLFEAIIFHDELGTGRGFDFNYLNPIIFYRAVEHDLGSPDNALIGMNAYALPIGNVAVYGQLLFDEFLLARFLNRGDSINWWGNKYGVQAGLKYVDAFTITNLDYQIEFNTVRPFTYSGRTPATSYAHFNQPLAHPLQANFRELVNILIYRPLPSLQFRFEYEFAVYGTDINKLNYGHNILRSYETRFADFGYKTTGGDKRTIHFVNFTATWQPKHNLFLDFNAVYREERGGLTTWTGQLALRLNIPERRFDW